LLALEQLEPEDETRLELLRHLANPGLAWIALGLINRITPEAFVNLRFIEFTDELLAMRLQKIDLAAAQLQRIDIDQAIGLGGRHATALATGAGNRHYTGECGEDRARHDGQ
jgi:hypothetical protein